MDSGNPLEAGGFENSDEIKDERYDEILEYVATQKEVSASLIQRRFRLGYPRAGDLRVRGCRWSCKWLKAQTSVD